MKFIVVSSLQWLAENKRCNINAFVIMPNHIHIMWQIADGVARKNVQGAFFSFTGHAFKKELERNPLVLEQYKVDDADRTYQFWERNPLVKECFTENFFLQKLDYLHHNPCQPKWNLTDVPENYYWSSASFYELQDDRFSWSTHYRQ